MPDIHQSNAPSPDYPPCPKCRLPMRWKRTRKTFTTAGVGILTVFTCEDCDEVVYREEK